MSDLNIKDLLKAKALVKNPPDEIYVMRQSTMLQISRSISISRDPYENDRNSGVLARMMYAPMIVTVPDHYIISSTIACGPVLPVVKIKYQNRKCLKRQCKHMAPKGGQWCRIHNIIKSRINK